MDKTIYRIPHFFSADECLSFVERAEKQGFEEAKVNQAGQQVMRKEIRDNDRVFISDVNLAHLLWHRISSHLPSDLGLYKAIGLNELFRVYRYKPGQQFKRHRDGQYHRNPFECSFYTLLIYLNDQFVGGETYFDHDEVTPEIGLAVAFQHELLHSGSRVFSGTKYVLRTDVMFRLIEDSVLS